MRSQRRWARQVVAVDVPRRGAALGDEAVQDRDGLVGVDAALTLDRERLAGELVHDVQQLQDSAVGGLVVLIVDRSHMIGRLGPQPAGRDSRDPEPLALSPPPRHSEPLLAPQPLCAFAVDLPALIDQQLMRGYPHRGRSREISRNAVRSPASPPPTSGS
jgi:hypothetical protein